MIDSPLFSFCFFMGDECRTIFSGLLDFSFGDSLGIRDFPAYPGESRCGKSFSDDGTTREVKLVKTPHSNLFSVNLNHSLTEFKEYNYFNKLSQNKQLFLLDVFLFLSVAGHEKWIASNNEVSLYKLLFHEIILTQLCSLGHCGL